MKTTEWQDLFYGVHLICLWDEKGATKIYDSLQEDIVTFIKQAQARVLAQREEQALLKAYITEWRKFFTQSGYLPLPFRQLEACLVVVHFNVFCYAVWFQPNEIIKIFRARTAH